MENQNGKKKWPIVVAILIVITAIIVGVLLYFNEKNKPVPSVETETTKIEETQPRIEEKVEEQVVDNSIILAFCGDSMVHLPQIMDAYDYEKMAMA